MFSPRIIPVLLCRDSQLVKSVKFKNYNYVGDPLNAVRIFNEFFADELIIFDIDATKKKKTISPALVSEIGAEASMPFAVGGGIDSLHQIEVLLRAGAEKVILCTAVFERMDFVREAVSSFGSSTIAVCVDVKRNLFGSPKVYSQAFRRTHSEPFIDYVAKVQESGAGEIIIQSVNRDGTFGGYDRDLYIRLSRSISCPIIALGGASGAEDILNLWNESSVNAFAAGSLFIYQGPLKGVLINYPKLDRNEFRFKFAR